MFFLFNCHVVYCSPYGKLVFFSFFLGIFSAFYPFFFDLNFVFCTASTSVLRLGFFSHTPVCFRLLFSCVFVSHVFALMYACPLPRFFLGHPFILTFW